VKTPEAIALRYAAAMESLRRDVAVSSESADTLVRRAEDALINNAAIPVPEERRDTHFAAVVQLLALKRAIPTMEAGEARERLIEILRPL
jgi:hypothetical protein